MRLDDSYLLRKERICRLRKGRAMENGPSGLTARLEHFDLRRKDKTRADFILNIASWGGRFGFAYLTIYYKQGEKRGFEIEPNSAVLSDIKIIPEEWRCKGIGSELFGVMKEFAKSEGVKRFYAHDVQLESEGFAVKMGFVRIDNPNWWIMKEL
jgi:GNAT superfamily N-acetyltransferase